MKTLVAASSPLLTAGFASRTEDCSLAKLAEDHRQTAALQPSPPASIVAVSIVAVMSIVLTNDGQVIGAIATTAGRDVGAG